MSAGRTNRIPIVGRNSEEGIIKSSSDWFFFGVIDLRFLNFTDAEPAQLIGEDESELDF